MLPWADMLYFNGGTIDFEKAIVLTWTSQCISMNKQVHWGGRNASLDLIICARRECWLKICYSQGVVCHFFLRAQGLVVCGNGWILSSRRFREEHKVFLVLSRWRWISTASRAECTEVIVFIVRDHLCVSQKHLAQEVILFHADFTKDTKFCLSCHAGAGLARLRVRSAQRLLCVYSQRPFVRH